MNRYDDIKRFKEKAKLEGIDYKEISESVAESSAHEWAILEQLSVDERDSGLLNSGRSTRAVPIPVASDELLAVPPVPAIEGSPLRASSAESGSVSSYAGAFAQVNAALAASAAPVAPQPAVNAAPVVQRAPASPQEALPEGERFKRMFNQKAPQPAAQNSGRNALLQPLLEMIALCR